MYLGLAVTLCVVIQDYTDVSFNRKFVGNLKKSLTLR
jgi:hypothetical protein